jgi:tetratricopeptide (TPR) repeat protein
MAEFTDQWLWFVDEELVDRLMAPDEVAPNASIRPAQAAAAGVAMGLHMQGRTREAASEIERAIDSGEPESDLHAIAGNLHFQLGEFEKAAEHFSSLRAALPDHPTAGFNLGVCHERLGRYELAIEAFTTAAARNNQLWQAHVGLGYCLLRLGRYSEALQAFQDSLELQPDSDKAVFGTAVALQSLGRLDEAEDAYVRLLPGYAENVEMLSNLVALAVVRKDYHSVRECSRHLLEVRPGSRVALEGLFTVALTDEDYLSAARYGEEIAALAPEEWRVWYNLGLANHKAGRLEAAVRGYREAIRLEPRSAEAHANLGTVLQESGDFAGAKASYEEALTLRPAPNRLWNLALACEQLGEVEEAELAYEQLVEINRDWADAWFRLATIRYDRGDLDRAMEGFERAGQSNPDWPEALVDIGVCYYRLGQSREAIESFRRALVLSPGNAFALSGMAAAAVMAGDAARAHDAYSVLRTAATPSPELAFNVGLILQKNGEHAKAVECYSEAVRLRPQFAEAYVNMGHALSSSGKEDEARMPHGPARWNSTRISRLPTSSDQPAKPGRIQPSDTPVITSPSTTTTAAERTGT